MRLTLRTLLAYLDDILEEDDTRLLKTKIEESGIATALIKRIQNSVDRPEIGALSPDAIGPLENANVMGEYLDSTLSPEQIAEIERLCLESDTSLSEAAACHQILTVVLGQPARVSDQLKKRIYDLPLSDELQLMEQQTAPAADTHSVKPSVAASLASHASLDIPASTDDETDDGSDRGMTKTTIVGAATPGQPTSTPTSPLTSATGVASTPGAAMPISNTELPTAIRPVGPDDSGVSAAAARIRNSADLDDDSGRSEAEIVAGATRAMLQRTDGYGGSIRPSRIVPWLVALALAGVVLFVLGQIFAPLGKRQRDRDAVAMIDATSRVDAPPRTGTAPRIDSAPPTEPASQGDTAAPTELAGRSTPQPGDTTSPRSTPDVDSSQPNNTSPATDPNLSRPDVRDAAGTVPAISDQADNEPAAADRAVSTRATDSSVTTGNEMASEEAVQPDKAVVEVPAVEESNATTPAMSNPDLGDADPADPLMTPGTPATRLPDAEPSDTAMPVVVEADTSQPTDIKTDAGAAVAVAELSRPGSFVIVREGDSWKRLVSPTATNDAATAEADATAAEPSADDRTLSTVNAGQTVVAPAYFRPIMADQSGLEWTLAGPTRMKIGVDPALGSTTQMIDGRLLLASTKPDVTAGLTFGRRHVKVAMPEAQTVLAIELTHLRAPGLNPLVPENRLPVWRIICVQGIANLQTGLVQDETVTQTGETVTLETAEELQGRGVQPPTTNNVDRLPAWIDPPSKLDGFVGSAREGLMEFVVKDEPIEKSLREAMAFRRVEVAALAAETLLLLDRADVYFGADGILNRPRQRLYWEEHFAMLRQQMASDTGAAQSIEAAIKRAELADSQNLYKLLVGFSPAELADGGDETLVTLLDSASMAVRVLAIENLRLITGETLGYRADQENANARKADIKKWETRLRRGDIRYPE